MGPGTGTENKSPRIAGADPKGPSGHRPPPLPCIKRERERGRKRHRAKEKKGNEREGRERKKIKIRRGITFIIFPPRTCGSGGGRKGLASSSPPHPRIKTNKREGRKGKKKRKKER